MVGEEVPTEIQTARAVGTKFFGPHRTVFVVNNDRSFLSHRATWAAAIKASGSRVWVLCQDTGRMDEIRRLGFTPVSVPFGREDLSVRGALVSVFTCLFWMLRIRPQLAFLSATAAYTLAWPGAVLVGAKVVRVVPGVGLALARTNSFASTVVRFSLRVSKMPRNVFSLFQVPDHADYFAGNKLAHPARSWVIGGAGVDTTDWRPGGEIRTEGAPLRVLLAARLYREKGVLEFVEVAKRLKGSGFEFLLAGMLDAGVTTSISEEDLNSWIRAGLISYLGEVKDMRPVFHSADIFMLPTTHPEGTPRVVIEASACGLPTLVSDQPGCRLTVLDGESGYVLDPADIESWCRALVRYRDDRALLARHGEAARDLAVREFSLEHTLERIANACGMAERR